MNKIIVTQEDKDKRLDVFLSSNLDGQTRNSVQKLIENGLILVNDKSIKKNYKISVNETITIQIPSLTDVNIEPENIPLDIVYEDEDLIVINKEKGMVVHPAPGHSSGTLVNALMFHCKDSLSGINGEIRPGIVHRIDKDTTGVLIVAKNDEAHLNLSKQIGEHTAKRVYNAIVFGNIRNDEGTIDKPIGRHETNRKKMSVFSKKTKTSVTHYRVLARYRGYTFIECELETGRTHQIRVHMQSIGHPIIGDEVYTTMKTKFQTHGQCLHAKKICFIHPKTQKQCEFETKLPEYFENIINKLEKMV